MKHHLDCGGKSENVRIKYLGKYITSRPGETVTFCVEFEGEDGYQKASRYQRKLRDRYSIATTRHKHPFAKAVLIHASFSDCAAPAQ